MAIGHTEHSPGLLGSAFHEEGPCMLIQRCFSSDPAWAQQPISLMRMRVNLGKPGTLKTFWRIFFFLTRWYNSFSKEKKIWVKSYMWFCWQSLMSKAEKNGQNPLPTGTDCGALFTPEHPKSSQLGLWFSFPWSSLFPSENTAAISLVLLTMNYSSWRRTWTVTAQKGFRAEKPGGCWFMGITNILLLKRNICKPSKESPRDLSSDWHGQK